MSFRVCLELAEPGALAPSVGVHGARQRADEPETSISSETVRLFRRALHTDRVDVRELLDEVEPTRPRARCQDAGNICDAPPRRTAVGLLSPVHDLVWIVLSLPGRSIFGLGCDPHCKNIRFPSSE